MKKNKIFKKGSNLTYLKTPPKPKHLWYNLKKRLENAK